MIYLRLYKELEVEFGICNRCYLLALLEKMKRSELFGLGVKREGGKELDFVENNLS